MMLVLSLVTSQLFMNTFGISLTPSLGTIVHSWGKVASVLGFAYQPSFLAELDALSNHMLCNEKPIIIDGEKSNGQLACNKGNEFDFELPPTIEIREPDYGIEPAKVSCLKSINKPWMLKDKNLDIEVLEMAADIDDETPSTEAKEEATSVVLPAAVATEASTDTPEADTKASIFNWETKVSTSGDEVQSSPKPEKLRKPCPNEQEQIRKEELRRLEEGRKYLEEVKENCDIPFFQAMIAKKSFEKVKRYRVIVRVAPQLLSRPLINNLEMLTGPDESEF
jgi:hypothetical protein